MMLLSEWGYIAMVKEYRTHYYCSFTEALEIIRKDLSVISEWVDKRIAKPVSIKDIKMTIQTKAALTLLIREVQDCKSQEQLNTLLGSWIKANDLHPEQVITLGGE